MRPSRQAAEEIAKTFPALAGGDETAPIRDRELDGRQRARAQDRARDDDAGRRLLLDNEIGADAEHRRLQGHPQHLRHRAEPARHIGRTLLRVHEVRIGRAPERPETPTHAHGLKNLGVADARQRQHVARCPALGRRLGRLTGAELGDEGDRDQKERPCDGSHADPEVKQEADGDIERHPGQIKERRRAEARKEMPDLVEIPDRLHPIPRHPLFQRQANENVVDAPIERFVEGGSDASEHAAAEHVEHALERNRAPPRSPAGRSAWARCGSEARGRRSRA